MILSKNHEMSDIKEWLRDRKATWMEAIEAMEAGAAEIEQLQGERDDLRLAVAGLNRNWNQMRIRAEAAEAEVERLLEFSRADELIQANVTVVRAAIIEECWQAVANIVGSFSRETVLAAIRALKE